MEKGISLIPVKEEHASFIHAIANHPELMAVLCEKPSEPNVWVDAINEWLNDNDEKDFIIKKGDEPAIGWIGVNGLQSKDGMAWIKMVAILPEYWGNGYGSAAIKLVKGILAEMGFKRVRLWTDECNTRAQLCYKANGFKVIDRRQGIVGTLNVSRDRFLMECDL